MWLNMTPLKGLIKRDGSRNEVAVRDGARAVKKPEKRPPVKKEKVNRVEQVRNYFRGVYSELKKVHWPNRREVVIYTSVVLVAVTIVGILIWIFDSLLSRLLELIIK
ncbi:MAG: preprotein translocase subunit SecE [Thermoanaerobacter sp.]|jgi:preprotein translocase subunit SecE|nr:preprotein translocase subunit SecE [Thermoanaerobacter sp.]